MADRKLLDLHESDLDLKIREAMKDIPTDFFDTAWDRKARQLGEELTGKDITNIDRRREIRESHDFTERLKIDFTDTKKQFKTKVINYILIFLMFLLGTGVVDFIKTSRADCDPPVVEKKK